MEKWLASEVFGVREEDKGFPRLSWHGVRATQKVGGPTSSMHVSPNLMHGWPSNSE